MSLAALGFHHAGRPIGDPRKAWATACGEAKMPSLLFHDLRRSAVRGMDRAGVRQIVAMKITGHKTPSMWRRYRITSARDVRDALALRQTAIRAQQGAQRGVATVGQRGREGVNTDRTRTVGGGDRCHPLATTR